MIHSLEANDHREFYEKPIYYFFFSWPNSFAAPQKWKKKI